LSAVFRAFIYGAGAHGRIVLDILRARGEGYEIAFIDDAPALAGTSISGVPVVASDVLDRQTGTEWGVVIAIGKPPTRLAIAERLEARGARFISAIHPGAMILPSAKVGVGCVISPGAVIDTGVDLGAHCIVNPNVLVGHDSRVGRGVTFAGGVVIGSRVEVGAGAFLCLGADIVPRVKVGAGAIIGAGALVMKDIPERVVATGSPARAVFPVDDAFDWAKVL
jgi:sugar O-acyltransferase (sialic acid O-acetyltransferase NeuD family)